MGKVLGLAPPRVHALGCLCTDFNSYHAAIDFDGNLHRVFLRSDFWGIAVRTERAGNDTGAGLTGYPKTRKHLDSLKLFGY